MATTGRGSRTVVGCNAAALQRFIVTYAVTSEWRIMQLSVVADVVHALSGLLVTVVRCDGCWVVCCIQAAQRWSRYPRNESKLTFSLVHSITPFNCSYIFTLTLTLELSLTITIVSCSTGFKRARYCSYYLKLFCEYCTVDFYCWDRIHTTCMSTPIKDDHVINKPISITNIKNSTRTTLPETPVRRIFRVQTHVHIHGTDRSAHIPPVRSPS